MRLLMLLALLVLTGCVSESPGKKDKPPIEASEMMQRQLDLGIGYLRNRDYQRAKEKLTRALEIDPKNATVHATFGLLFQLEGEPDLAEKYFRSAVKFDPDSAQARNSYGAFLFAEKRYAEAVEQLKLASENRFYPNRSTVFENLGVAYVRLGDVPSADYAFTRATQLNPGQARALLELADIRFGQQQFTESRELYSRHSRVAPNSAKRLWLCIRLARVFRNHNDEASCAEALEGIFPASDEYREYKASLKG